MDNESSDSFGFESSVDLSVEGDYSSDEMETTGFISEYSLNEMEPESSIDENSSEETVFTGLWEPRDEIESEVSKDERILDEIESEDCKNKSPTNEIRSDSYGPSDELDPPNVMEFKRLRTKKVVINEALIEEIFTDFPSESEPIAVSPQPQSVLKPDIEDLRLAEIGCVLNATPVENVYDRMNEVNNKNKVKCKQDEVNKNNKRGNELLSEPEETFSESNIMIPFLINSQGGSRENLPKRRRLEETSKTHNDLHNLAYTIPLLINPKGVLRQNLPNKPSPMPSQDLVTTVGKRADSKFLTEQSFPDLGEGTSGISFPHLMDSNSNSDVPEVTQPIHPVEEISNSSASNETICMLDAAEPDASAKEISASYKQNCRNQIVAKAPAAASKNGKKQPNTLQSQYFCETCQIPCTGQSSYNDHMVGQKHKKKQLIMAKIKTTDKPTAAAQGKAEEFLCNLCKISCNSKNSYNAHVRGAKHLKVLKLRQNLGQTVPGNNAPPKSPSITCPLCQIKCSGRSTYDSHLKGSKHKKALQLHDNLNKPVPKIAKPKVSTSDSKVEKKKKSSADDNSVFSILERLEVDMADRKDDVSQQPGGSNYKKLIQSEDRRASRLQCKICNCKFDNLPAKEEHLASIRHQLMYKEKVNPMAEIDVPQTRIRRPPGDLRNRIGDDFYRNRDLYDEPRCLESPPMPMHSPRLQPVINMPEITPQRSELMPHRPDSLDDKLLSAKLVKINPKEKDVIAIETYVGMVENSLKLISGTIGGNKSAMPYEDTCEDRILKGCMKVGSLAKGLLLKGDRKVELVIMTTTKPTVTLLEKVSKLLAKHLKDIGGEEMCCVSLKKEAIVISHFRETKLKIVIHLTSPTMRDQPQGYEEIVGFFSDPPDVLDRDNCLETLVALRQSKWFQAQCVNLQFSVKVIKLFLDLGWRVPTWSHLSSWIIELVVEKVLNTTPEAQSLGEAFWRVMESISSGLLLSDEPGLMDPCEKESVNVLKKLNVQTRENITACARYALKLLSTNKLHKVLGMEPLPSHRKRQRVIFSSDSEAEESDDSENYKKKRPNDDDLYEP